MATTATTVERDHAVDVVRGALVVLLVLIEYLPAPATYPWLRHSPWDGIRIADVVFPGFLFVVGASMAASARARRGVAGGSGTGSWLRAARRLALLVALGLVFNAASDLTPLRLTGVLQTIGVSGFLAWSVVRRVHRAGDAALVAGALLALHGALLSHAFAVDRWVFADRRLYREGLAGHDPEGVLMTLLGATALVLLGWATTSARSWRFVAALAAVAAASWTVWEPNKRAWTPTFTLVIAAGFAVLLLVLRGRRVAPLEAVGRNALLVYLGQHVVRELLLDPLPDDTALGIVGFGVAAAVTWSVAAVVLGRLGVRLRV